MLLDFVILFECMAERICLSAFLLSHKDYVLVLSKKFL